jgi:hypothetical protein
VFDPLKFLVVDSLFVLGIFAPLFSDWRMFRFAPPLQSPQTAEQCLLYWKVDILRSKVVCNLPSIAEKGCLQVDRVTATFFLFQ